MKINATTVFCDSYREEVGGSSSVIGIFPETVFLESIPGAMSRVSTYTLIHFDSLDRPEQLEVFLRFPNGSEEARSSISQQQIDDAATPKPEGSTPPISGLIISASASPFHVIEPGRVLSILKTPEGEQIIGQINFLQGTAPA